MYSSRSSTIGASDEAAIYAGYACTIGSSVKQSGIFGGALNVINNGVSFSGIYSGYNNTITAAASQIAIMGSQNTGSGNYNTIVGNYMNSNAKNGVTMVGDNYNSTISASRNNYVVMRGFNGFDFYKDNATKIAEIGSSSGAAMQLFSTTGMFVPPVMTATQAEAISTKITGGIIYSTDGSGTTITSSGWWGWNGTTWN